MESQICKLWLYKPFLSLNELSEINACTSKVSHRSLFWQTFQGKIIFDRSHIYPGGNQVNTLLVSINGTRTVQDSSTNSLSLKNTVRF